MPVPLSQLRAAHRRLYGELKRSDDDDLIEANFDDCLPVDIYMEVSRARLLALEESTE
jgi:hypothetical protein